MVFFMAKSTQNKEIAEDIQEKSANSRSAAKNNMQTPIEEELELEQENQDSYKNEIILILTLLASILSLISILGIGGIVGKYFRTFIFGTMGLLGYFFPFVLFFTVIFILSNYQNKRILSKIFCCIGIYFIFMGLFQLLFYGNSDFSIIEMYFHCATTTLGGGLFGALLTIPLSSIIGVAGTCVILLAVFLILLTFITSRFLLSTLGEKGEKEIRKMHQQYQAEKTEKMVIRESYRELPPRKRGASITFDLSQDDAIAGSYMEETIPVSIASSVPISIAGNAEEIELSPKQEKTMVKKKKTQQQKSNIVSIEDAKKRKESSKNSAKEEKKIEKEPEKMKTEVIEKKTKKEPKMKEYEPSIEEEKPITRNTKEIRKELEQSLFAENPLEQDYFPGRPSIHFVDASTKSKYMRKVIPEPKKESEESISFHKEEKKQITELNKHSENKQEILSIEEKPETTSEKLSMEQEIIPKDDRQQASETDMIEESYQEIQKEEHVFHNQRNAGGFERFTKEKKFDGSILEGTEETLKPNTQSDYMASGYIFPPMDLLAKPSNARIGSSAEEIQAITERLRQTFESFKVRVNFGNVSCGPAVTRYEIQPEQGVKVSKITNLADDIKLNLAAADIRIEAPIPGKAAIGIEVPNRETSPVFLRELLEYHGFKEHKSKIAFAVGKDVSGQPIVTDIAKMPHLLIAGATGSGKSVCINTLIMSILYKANPDDVKLIMVDPKVVELSVYNGIPHLLIPVVTDPKNASAALNWAVTEMTDRYGKFAELGVRDLTGYNKKITELNIHMKNKEETKDENKKETIYKKLPQIVIIVDELADLMMVSPGEVEDAICRLAQMARAAGLHLVIATQRPSVNVITGVIKANVPSRIAFSVSSAVDSRTIIDGVGAEKLLGKGDMLFFPSGLPKPIRVQGAFVSDTEVSHVVEFLREQNKMHSYDTTIAEKITAGITSTGTAADTVDDRDNYFSEAGKFIIEKEKASIGMLQRVYKIGFNRAARIMDQLAQAGVVGPEEGTKPRKILMTMEEFEQYLEEYL